MIQFMDYSGQTHFVNFALATRVYFRAGHADFRYVSVWFNGEEHEFEIGVETEKTLRTRLMMMEPR